MEPKPAAPKAPQLDKGHENPGLQVDALDSVVSSDDKKAVEMSRL